MTWPRWTRTAWVSNRGHQGGNRSLPLFSSGQRPQLFPCWAKRDPEVTNAPASPSTRRASQPTHIPLSRHHLMRQMRGDESASGHSVSKQHLSKSYWNTCTRLIFLDWTVMWMRTPREKLCLQRPSDWLEEQYCRETGTGQVRSLIALPWTSSTLPEEPFLDCLHARITCD